MNDTQYSHLQSFKILFTLGTQQKKKEFNIVKPNILQSHNVIVLLPVFMLQNGVNTKNQDDCWMNMAIKLASNGIGLTSPNPCVGAVIVHENQVIGSGFHKKAGLPHAEREAIADGVANGNAPLFADSTLYVTLEPCSTSGKTPPCTDAILKHRFKRVVYGSEDPNPKHRGAALIFLNRPASRLPAGFWRRNAII